MGKRRFGNLTIAYIVQTEGGTGSRPAQTEGGAFDSGKPGCEDGAESFQR